MDIDLLDRPLGRSSDGTDVFLSDLWPTARGPGDDRGLDAKACSAAPTPTSSPARRLARAAGPRGRALRLGARLDLRAPAAVLRGHAPTPGTFDDIAGARCLVRLGDSVTTDHISPAGSIKPESPAGRYLTEHGVERKDFNSYGSRRGNHEVMVRGTFANVRLRNLLVPGSEGLDRARALGRGDDDLRGVAALPRRGDADDRARRQGVRLGSSRDWAAKGPNLLGVRAVIAESYERIHRSNLLMMGILPLQFRDGETPDTLGLSGREEFAIEGIENGEASEVTVRAGETAFTARVRLDTPREREYLRHGGILPYVLRRLLANVADSGIRKGFVGWN